MMPLIRCRRWLRHTPPCRATRDVDAMIITCAADTIFRHADAILLFSTPPRLRLPLRHFFAMLRADFAAAALIAADAAAYADMPMPLPPIDADAMPHA
jgi:hypothetical protein